MPADAARRDGNIPKPANNADKDKDKVLNLRVHYWAIFFMWCKAIGFLLLIFSIFLACILKNRVTFQGEIKNLDGVMVIPNPETGDPDKEGRYLYTSFQQPKILLILGILGFVAVSISSNFMDILAVWISNKWLSDSPDSAETEPKEKVTPMDVATMIRIIDGGWFGFYNYLCVMKEGHWLGSVIRALFGANKHRIIKRMKMCSWAVHYPGIVLSVIMAVGTGISAAGMSMHMKSKPVRLVTRRKVPKEKYALLGRRVATHCTEDSDLPCSVAGQFDSSNDVYLRNAFETFRTLKNELSRVHDIQDHDAGPEGRHTYIKKADIPSGADYEAVTYSITTTCSVIKKQCLIQPSMDPNMYESCIRPPIFDEMTGNKRFQLLMSADSAGYRKAHPSNLTNPYYLAVRASRGTLRGGSDSGAQSRASITDQADSGEDVINLWCGVTVHDVSYASTNNTIVNWSSKPVNATLARIFAAPSFSDLSTALLGEEMRATYARTPDEIDLCKSLSRFYSWTAVAFVAGTMEEVVSIHEWRRVESSGTKLPHSILKTLYAFVGILTGISILLVILAVFAARKHNGRWFEVKMLLSVEGAVAQALRETGGESREQLECVWDMYEERTAPDEEAVVVEKKKKWVEVKVEDDHGKMVPKWEVKPAVKGKKEGCSCGGGGEVWVVPTQDGEGDGGMGDR